MKLYIAIFLSLVLVVTVISVPMIHAQTSEDKLDYTYFESAYINLNLKYPADWTLVEGNPELPFMARIWAPGNTAMISIHHQYQETPMTAEENAKLHLKQYQSDVEGIDIIESNPIMISGHNSWQLTHSGLNYQGYEFTTSDVYVTAENSEYIFSYNVWDGFPDYLPIFNSIVNTVQIISTDTDDVSDDSFSFSYIPDWVENNARWWNAGKIDNRTFISGIQFLIKNDIIAIPSTLQDASTTTSQPTDYSLTDGDLEKIRHDVRLWVEGRIDDVSFIRVIEYLATQDAVSNDSKNPEDCPISFNSRCITGTVTEIFDGDNVQVDNALFRLALVSPPELDEMGGKEAKEFLEGICPVGSDALVDQDDLRPLEGLSGTGRIMVVVYCNGLNLNEELVKHNFEYFDGTYCYTSEFADDHWAREGCSEWN